ncbi:MAG: class I SAM-dependent methyltransferase [Ktedonobacteraceae bacterium]|nr:class I SAM-dependent methyltransferase [Ktedonobacteraceae bacterium]
MKAIIRKLFQRTSSESAQVSPDLCRSFPDFDKDDIELIRKVQPFTKTGPVRIFSLIKAVEYVVNSRVPGDIVECGVWKGGSIMAIAYTLLKLGETTRNIYLFDTFEGMTTPTKEDITYEGLKASDLLRLEVGEKYRTSDVWSYASIDQVKKAVLSTGYDATKIHFVKGCVEETLPEKAPERISLLRLDTDWYESTRHELLHLFPRLSVHGVIIIDDYGHWLGAKKAIDEYLRENTISLLLNRIDYSGRIGVKSHPFPA